MKNILRLFKSYRENEKHALENKQLQSRIKGLQGKLRSQQHKITQLEKSLEKRKQLPETPDSARDTYHRVAEYYINWCKELLNENFSLKDKLKDKSEAGDTVDKPLSHLNQSLAS